MPMLMPMPVRPVLPSCSLIFAQSAGRAYCPHMHYEQEQKQDGVATNLERTDIGMSMGTGDGKPAPLLKANKKKTERKGMTTTPERTGIGTGIGEW